MKCYKFLTLIFSTNWFIHLGALVIQRVRILQILKSAFLKSKIIFDFFSIACACITLNSSMTWPLSPKVPTPSISCIISFVLVRIKRYCALSPRVSQFLPCQMEYLGSIILEEKIALLWYKENIVTELYVIQCDLRILVFLLPVVQYSCFHCVQLCRNDDMHVDLFCKVFFF